MDVKTIFQKLNLSKDVYKTQPGVFTPRVGSKVCKLHKSINGLKQASMSWNIRFNKTIKDFFFSQIRMKLVCTRRLVSVQPCSKNYMWMTY